MIRFKCPHCGKEVSAGDEHAGKNGRCPGCKGLFQIPAVRAARPTPAPAAERRTPPPRADDDEDETPRRKKPAADYEVVEDEDEAPPRRKPARDDEDDEYAAPRKKKRPRDEEDDEPIAEAPRKKRPARDDEDDRPRRKRARDYEDEEDDEPRARRKRGRDEEDDEDDEDDRPRRKKKRRKGPYADCPNCGCRGDATRIYYSFGWGFLPMFFSTVRCNRCGTEYNGKHGDYNLKRYLIYMAIVVPIALILGFIGAILESK